MLIRQGIAELIEDEEDYGYETATAEPIAERAVLPAGVKRKRGRPKGSRNRPKDQ